MLSPGDSKSQAASLWHRQLTKPNGHYDQAIRGLIDLRRLLPLRTRLPEVRQTAPSSKRLTLGATCGNSQANVWFSPANGCGGGALVRTWLSRSPNETTHSSLRLVRTCACCQCCGDWCEPVSTVGLQGCCPTSRFVVLTTLPGAAPRQSL